MSLRDALASGRFVVTAEVGPPKGTDIADMLSDVELLAPRVTAINVTDQQSAVSGLAACAILKQRGLEPVFQVTCRDRNRIGLQSDLLGAAALGIENVLCLTGDYVTLGDHPQARPVFDLDSVSLLRAVTTLMQGQDTAGKPLKGTPVFFAGAVVSPGADPLEPQIAKMEKKVRAGAQFFQTQAVYEPELFAAFMERVRPLGVPVMAGIVLLKSAGMARFMNRNVAGVRVPEELIAEMDDAPSKAAKSIEIAARLIAALRPYCQGVHIMAIGWEKRIPAVLDSAGL
jgi:methylenetetrahydrofolate reductase (NADPH)